MALFIGVMLVPRAGVAGADPSRGVFPRRTRDVLVFADNLGGRTVVDLDHRVAVRRWLPGRDVQEGPGPRPVRVGDTFLVVGIHGQTLAVPLDGGEPRPLGRAPIALAAAEPGKVWLIDDSVPEHVREVDLEGNVVFEREGESGSYPLRGVPGGFVVFTRSGLAVWDAETGEVSQSFGPDPWGLSAAVHGNLVAWRNDAGLHFTKIGGADVIVNPSGSMSLGMGEFSPDGRWFAAGASEIDPNADVPINERRVLIDVRTARVGPVLCRGFDIADVAWSSDGERVYCASWSKHEAQTTVSEYVVATGARHTRVLPFGGLFGFLVVDERDAGHLVHAPRLEPEQCPAPVVESRARAEGCGFRF